MSQVPVMPPLELLALDVESTLLRKRRIRREIDHFDLFLSCPGAVTVSISHTRWQAVTVPAGCKRRVAPDTAGCRTTIILEDLFQTTCPMCRVPIASGGHQ